MMSSLFKMERQRNEFIHEISICTCVIVIQISMQYNFEVYFIVSLAIVKLLILVSILYRAIYE